MWFAFGLKSLENTAPVHKSKETTLLGTSGFPSWVPSGRLQGTSWCIWVPLRCLLGASGCAWVPLGCLLGASCVPPGYFLVLLGASWVSTGCFWMLLGASGCLRSASGVPPGCFLCIRGQGAFEIAFEIAYLKSLVRLHHTLCDFALLH